MRTKIFGLFLTLIFGCTIFSSAQNGKSLPFKAGAAKVNISPEQNPLPGGYGSIHDSLYARALVIDNGSASAALVSIDNGFLSEAIWKDITEGIKAGTGIPVENVFLCPSHTHSAPMLMMPPSTSTPDTPADPAIAKYVSQIEKAIIDVVRKAKSNVQPARIGYGTGSSWFNVNRDLIDPETRLWTQGPNYDGGSDHNVYVVKVEAASGELIGVFINFAMHANWMYMSGVISAGLPGGVAKYIEEYYKNFYDNDVVALWSMGAAGDQNPVYFGGPGMRGVTGPKADAAFERKVRMISSFGQVMGEEVIRVLQQTKRLNDKLSIRGCQKTVTCQGRTRTDTDNRQGKPGSYSDGDPVNIKLSLLQLGDIAFAGVNAELYNSIARRLQKESPVAETIFVSITNGGSNSGYIPSDEAFGRYTFQVLGSRLQPGCAENAIVNGLLDMIDQTGK